MRQHNQKISSKNNRLFILAYALIYNNRRFLRLGDGKKTPYAQFCSKYARSISMSAHTSFFCDGVRSRYAGW